MKNVESMYPLTAMQQGMLFHALFSPESGVYIEQRNWTLQGDIDAGALDDAWQTVIARHQVLRTAIVWEGLDQPLQIVGHKVRLPLRQHDWRAIPTDQQQQRFQAFLKDDREKPFEFISAPLMRMNLFRMKDETYKFVWTHHHVLLDGWSASLVLKEVFAVYRAACRHEKIQLGPARPYQDYVAWLAKQDVSKAQAYWRERLKGFDSPTQVTDGRRVKSSHAASSTGERHIYLSKEKTAALGQYARRLRVTTNTLLEAAWALLLSRYSHTRDVVFGVTVSGRPPSLEGVEDMVGLFINTLPLRVGVDPKMPVATWLKEIQEQQLQMKQFEYSALVEVQRVSEIAATDSLFETILVFENYPVSESLDQFERDDSDASSGMTQSYEQQHYQLTLAGRQGDRLGLGLVYDRERFEVDTIASMLTQLEQILTGLLQQPQYVRELKSLTAAQETQLLVEWNRTTRMVAEQSVQELFERAVSQYPAAVAVEFGQEKMNYAELNKRANQLAHYLEKLGVGPDSIVGICIERSMDMLVGLLGILKSGGAYLPLDPENPRERLKLMLADSGAKVLLTRQIISHELPWLEVEVVHLDSDWPLIARASSSNPAVRITLENLAYVLYTSGSTGRPKGVAMPHRALVNLLQWQMDRSGSACRPRTLQFTSLGFDVSFQEIFSTCCAGGTLVFISEESRRDMTSMLRIVKDGKIERLFVPFIALQSLAEAAKQQEIVPADLREVITAGEQLKITGELRDLFAGLPVCKLDNQYGPTEAHVVSAHLLAPPSADWPELPPIGRPIWNTQLFVLDELSEPSAIGFTGDLYIGGTCVARGYLGQPEMTAERFIPHPFSKIAGARLYRTGDLARYLPDGSLEFLGRSDHQVKIRGYRTELGEIESVLCKHEAVREAAVVVRDEAREKDLVAYIAPDPQYLRRREAATKSVLEAEHVRRWEVEWDQTYEKTGGATPPANTSAANADNLADTTYTEQVEESLEHTAQQILLHRPKRVLEIGCGSGGLLLKLAPHCLRYVGTDVSAAAIRLAESRLATPETNFAHVTLLNREAQDLEDLEGEDFDAIILNSVVQYLPDAEYLARLLQKLLKKIKSRGFIFVGNAMNLRLLEVFHTAAELEHAPAGMSTAELFESVQRLVAQEKELWLDPNFFSTMKDRLPDVSSVELQLKRGDRQRNPTRFQYDVILHVGPRTTPDFKISRSWKEHANGSSSVRRLLEENRFESLIVAGVPNPRLVSAAKAAALLKRRDRPEKVGNLLGKLPASASENGVDPEEFWRIGSELNYSVEIGWSNSGDVSEYDVKLCRGSATDVSAGRSSTQASHELREQRGPLANRPLRALLSSKLMAQLRDHLQDKLPAYMVPTSFVLLEEMPRTLNGKINRKALPKPDHARSELLKSYVAPRDALEQQLAQIWEETLNVRPVGIRDDFFDLGGHSLRAIVVVGKIQKRFGRQLPVSLFFPRIDIETLADRLRERPKSAPASLLLKIQPQGDAPPFFCVHPSTGFAFHFAPLARHLGLKQPFYGLQAPGLDQDIEPLADAKEMASRYLRAVREIQSRGPYFIGGASMGGRVAYEMAQQLRQENEQLALLALFDSGMEEDDHRPSREHLEKVDNATILASALKGYMSLPLDRLREMSSDEQALYVLEQAKPLDMFPPGFGVEHFQRLFKVFKANAVAWISYVPRPYEGKITLFRAVEQSEEMSSDWFLGWERLAPGRVEVHEVPGSHVSIFREPHVRILARRLAACIAAA